MRDYWHAAKAHVGRDVSRIWIEQCSRITTENQVGARKRRARNRNPIVFYLAIECFADCEEVIGAAGHPHAQVGIAGDNGCYGDGKLVGDQPGHCIGENYPLLGEVERAVGVKVNKHRQLSRRSGDAGDNLHVSSSVQGIEGYQTIIRSSAEIISIRI